MYLVFTLRFGGSVGLPGGKTVSFRVSLKFLVKSSTTFSTGLYVIREEGNPSTVLSGRNYDFTSRILTILPEKHRYSMT